MRVKRTIEVEVCEICSEEFHDYSDDQHMCLGCDREICTDCMDEAHMGYYTSGVWCSDCSESLNVYDDFEKLHIEHVEKYELARLSLIAKWKEICQKQLNRK